MTLPADERFEEVFSILYPRAIAVAQRIVDDRSAAEDIAAEALARAFERWHRIRDLPWLDGWVLRVAANLALTTAARRPPPRARPATDPTDEADAVSNRLALVAALHKLPRRQRDAIVLRYLADLSERDTATVMRCAPGTLKSHLHRALTALRAQLSDTEVIDLALEA